MSVARTTEILAQFGITEPLAGCEPYGSGHVNDSFCCSLASGKKLLMQRINHYVFRDIDKLMHNVAAVVTHLAKRNGDKPHLQLLQTADQRYYVKQGEEYWRGFHFIEGARTVDIVDSPELAFQGGKAFGEFILKLADLTEPLYETIPNFHHLPTRLQQLQTAIRESQPDRLAAAQGLIQHIQQQQDSMLTIQKLRDAQKLPERITHNDTKFNNVLLDERDEAVCVIDLDTVMPGLVHFDFADAVRIICNTAAEDEADLQLIDIDLEKFSAFCEGFLPQLATTLTPLEKETLAEALPLMPYMLSIRFLTDYLTGDRYFRIHKPQHNLIRAKAQFALAEKLQTMKPSLAAVIDRSW